MVYFLKSNQYLCIYKYIVSQSAQVIHPIFKWISQYCQKLFEDQQIEYTFCGKVLMSYTNKMKVKIALDP